MSKILVSGGLVPTTKDTLLDARTRVATFADIANIENPARFMVITVEDTGKKYEVRKLASKIIGGIVVENSTININDPEALVDLGLAEELRSEDEKVRQSNEKKRVEAESLRKSAEDSRKSNENSRISSENARVESERTRVSSEETRNANEQTRNSNETKRQSQESTRQSQESARQSNESTRNVNESARKESESGRKAEETSRRTAELSRKDAENIRVKNEQNRTTAENTRSSAEDRRVSNETQRTANETARNNAELSREQAEGNRASTFNTLKGQMQTTIQEGQTAVAATEKATSDAQKVVDEYDTKVAEQDSKLAELGSKEENDYNVLNDAVNVLLNYSIDVELERINAEIISNKFINGDGKLQDISNNEYSVLKINVSEGNIFKIQGRTSPVSNGVYALYGGGNLIYKRNASLINEKESFVIIPKGVDTLYVQKMTYDYPQYKVVKYTDKTKKIFPSCVINPILGFDALAKLFSYNQESAQTDSLPNKFIDSNGVLADNSNNIYTVLKTSVSEGDILMIRSWVTQMGNSRYAFYNGSEKHSYYVNDKLGGDFVSFIFVPKGADTLYVPVVNNIGFINRITFDSLADIPSVISSLMNRVSNVELKEVEIERVISEITNPIFEEISLNRTYGKYIDGNTGELRDVSDQLFNVGSATIEAGKTYKITGVGYQGNAAYSITDSEGNVLAKKIITTSYVPEIDTIIAPANASIIYIEGVENKDYEKSSLFMSVGYEPKNNSKKWIGKKWVCVGDSLTEHNIRASKNYHDYVSEETGIEVVNMGRSGTGYKRTEDEGFSFYQRVANIPMEADVITIFGSGNDNPFFASEKLGTASDTGTETVGGCVNTTLDNIYTRIPMAVVGIVSPTPWIGYSPTNKGNGMENYSALLKEICERRGIPFLDLYHCSGLRPDDSTFRGLAYSRDEGNGVHPDENGHKLIAPRFKAFLETLIM